MRRTLRLGVPLLLVGVAAYGLALLWSHLAYSRAEHLLSVGVDTVATVTGAHPPGCTPGTAPGSVTTCYPGQLHISYTVAGTTYRTTVDTAYRYSRGDTVDVVYDPRYPSHALLPFDPEPEGGWAPVINLMGNAGLVLGAAAVLVPVGRLVRDAVRRRRAASRDAGSRPAAPDGAKPGG